MNLKPLPNVIIKLIYEYVIFFPKTKEELQNAVNCWCSDENKMKYDYIST